MFNWLMKLLRRKPKEPVPVMAHTRPTRPVVKRGGPGPYLPPSYPPVGLRTRRVSLTEMQDHDRANSIMAAELMASMNSSVSPLAFTPPEHHHSPPPVSSGGGGDFGGGGASASWDCGSSDTSSSSGSGSCSSSGSD
jgi:hypothetical protein